MTCKLGALRLHGKFFTAGALFPFIILRVSFIKKALILQPRENRVEKESIFQWNRGIMFNKAMEYKEQGKQEKKQGIFSEKIHKQKNNQF